jgi:hypothetical protein
LRGKGRKWKLWRSSSGDHGSLWRGSRGGSHRSAASEASDDTSSVAAPADAFTAAVATVARAPARDFMAVRQEWATIRIQTAFRGFLVLASLQKKKKLPHFILFLAEGLGFVMGLLPLVHR